MNKNKQKKQVTEDFMNIRDHIISYEHCIRDMNCSAEQIEQFYNEVYAIRERLNLIESILTVKSHELELGLDK